MDNGRIGSAGPVDAAAWAPGGTGSPSSRPRQDCGNANSSARPPIKCPRCESLNTKFCYFNNYSQSQPRHFCKSCRRYWTEGGALRNVPVGGGCRKNKRLKQRPLLSIGAAAGGVLAGSSLMDETTTNMLACLANSSSPFPTFTGSSPIFDNSNNQLLSLMVQRFQEPMRLAQPSDQSPTGGLPYPDVGFPGLVHSKNPAPLSCLCRVNPLRRSGVMMGGLEGNLGFGDLASKGELDATVPGFCNGAGGGYDMSSLYQDSSNNMHMVGPSATAILASIEDQLSSFSNLATYDSLHTDSPMVEGAEPKPCGTVDASRKVAEQEGQQQQQQMLGQVSDIGDALVELAFEADIQPEADTDEKPLLNRIAFNNDFSLLMNIGNNWQQPSLTNDMLPELQTNNLWPSPLAMSRWQDNAHSLPTSATAAAAGSVM